MKQEIAALREEAKKEIELVSSLGQLDELRVKYMGKKGKLTELSKGMKDLSVEERPEIGQLINEAKNEILEAFTEKNTRLVKEQKEKKLKEEIIDISLPSRNLPLGTEHPITETMNFMKNIFTNMGFDVADGPEIEYVKYNFDALNIPKTHPSRDLTDTFYINPEVVLRTQTSPVQIRYMLEHKPPFRMICPGKVYRPDYDCLLYTSPSPRD